MSTIRFDRDERKRDPLLRQAADLPREVEPARDLWPDIRARIEGEAPGAQPVSTGLSWGWAAAAGIAVAALSVLFTWMSVRSPAPLPVQLAEEAPTPVEAIRPVSYGSYARLGPEYIELRSQLLGEFRGRLAELPPETRLRVEEDLAAIQRAADDIDAALAGDPASRLLNQMLLSTYQEELRLYSRVAMSETDAGQRT